MKSLLKSFRSRAISIWPILKVFLIIGVALLGTNFENVHAAAWKLSKSFWSEEDEVVYQNFVERLGSSKYSNLNKFIRDPKANPLYGEEDKKIGLYPDCADLPYLIRAYVAYKLRLPFSYVSSISGKGGDQRYSDGNRPIEFRDHDYFSSPKDLFRKVTLINSGFFRMSAKQEESDHYPVKIQRESIVPGTIYYDPNGHVAMVSKVTDDGRIRMIDAHPDRSISKPWFGPKFSRGTEKNGGGFKRWRPIRYTSDGKISRSSNHNIPDYSASEQYGKQFSYRGRLTNSYFDFIRGSLSKNGGKIYPIKEFSFMMKDLYEDLCYRAVAVNLAIKKGLHKKSHPGALPWNIYGTDGVWEELSTPSRDARLKVSFLDFYHQTIEMIRKLEMGNKEVVFNGSPKQLAIELISTYDILSHKYSISYQNSAGKNVDLTFDKVLKRLFDLSFDPYHSIELRWGAKGSERATGIDGELKIRFYNLEKRLRNQLERVYNQPTPLSLGSEMPPEVDIRAWLKDYVEGNSSLMVFAQGNPYPDSMIKRNQMRLPSLPVLPNAQINKPIQEVNSTLVSQIKIDHPEVLAASIVKLESKIEKTLPANEPELDIATSSKFILDLLQVGDRLAAGLMNAKVVSP